MIGQKENITRINKMIDKGTFPRFSIIVGQKGSGRKTLVREIIAPRLSNLDLIVVDTKIDDIRDMIKSAYKIAEPVVYMIADADGMSGSAKNSLLKIVEEPPNNAYFIMTLEDENNTLDTIRSRGSRFRMDNYSFEELSEYLDSNYNLTINNEILDLCDTIGDVKTLVDMGLEEFLDFVDKVIDNIATTSGANSFRIAEKIALKGEDDKYDLKLFWRAFISKVMKRARLSKINVIAVNITSNYLSKLRYTGINKQGLFDMWILDIRKEWM